LPDTVALTSYPRSGNTLLRSYLEKIMGIATGSGGSPGDKLIQKLKAGGFAGETITDKRTHIIKTHSPDRSGKNMFLAERAILLVRNPLDVLVSQFNMLATGSHHLSIPEDKWAKLTRIYADFAKQEIEVWSEFNEFWAS